VKVALKEVPTDLYDSFALTLERIDKQPNNLKSLAHRILLWLSRSKRPLSVNELQQFLALRPGCSSVEKEDMPTQRTMVHVCMGLVMIDQRSSIISLVHYSLQEYFQDSTIDIFLRGEATIAEACLTILSFDEFAKGHCRSDKSLDARLLQFPILTYAACNWGHHAREAEKVNMGMVLDFLQNDLKVSSASQAMFTPGYKYRGHSQGFPKRFTGVHVASFFGLKDAVNELLAGNAKSDTKDSFGRRPLTLSARNGHVEVVERLLAANADVNASVSMNGGQTALQAAAEGGHLEAVEKLLAANANVNAAAARYDGRTALQAAAERGHSEIVERLLAANADVNAAAAVYDGRTALQAAAAGGYLGIVERLLSANAHVNAAAAALLLKDRGRMALQAAAEGGHLSVVQRLLAADADVNAADASGRTALYAASSGGHLDVVERLLAANANVNAAATGYSGRTALQAAAEGGHLKVVEKLLTANADVNASNGSRTALQAAAEGGHLDVVKRLLAANADVNAHGYRMALQEAARGGHLEVVERLLTANADVNATDDNGL
jgi:ankyrin repeat protein